MGSEMCIRDRFLPAAPTEPAYPILTDDAVLAEVAAALADTGVAVADIEIARLKAETDVAGFAPFFEPVSYTHLTLPTIYSV